VTEVAEAESLTRLAPDANLNGGGPILSAAIMLNSCLGHDLGAKALRIASAPVDLTTSPLKNEAANN
jgi:hypothetical protein